MSETFPGVVEDALARIASVEKPPDEKPPNVKPDDRRRCPKCGTFAEIVQIADDKHLPGYHCNKDGCGWSADLADKDKIKPICVPTLILGGTLSEMLRMAPLNETIRAQVHSKFLKPIPRTCVTYESILQWVSVAVEQDVINKIMEYEGLRVRPVPAAMPAGPALSLNVEYSYVEEGRCNYSVSRIGEQYYTLTVDEIRELANRNPRMSDFLNAVRSRLIYKAQENPPDTSTDEESYSYDDHNSEDSRDDSFNIGTRYISDRLLEFIDEHIPHIRELLEE